jgi:predicted alpha/beta hydrolase family esterase
MFERIFRLFRKIKYRLYGKNKLCEQCGHLFDPHELKGRGKPPTKGWMTCPVEGCKCYNTWSMDDKMKKDLQDFKTDSNCIIIHGCPSNIEKAMDPATRTYDKHWIPWLKQQLEWLGIPTSTPLMPEPWEPVYEKFKAEFEKQSVDENSILIGHSCGTTFLLRWLSETKQKISKLILVAPWAIADKDDEARRAFYEHPIDPSIKDRVGEIIFFTSNDEDPDGVESLNIIHRVIGGTIISLPNHGHYTQGDMGTDTFPELLEAAMK